MEELKTEVAIVGAGPAGALLACLLAGQGIAVTLVEKHGSLAREFRGEHLHDDSVELLKRHGLWPEVESAGLLPMQFIQMMDGPRPVLTVTPELFGIEHVGIHIPQEHLLEPMIRRASASPDFRLLLGATAQKLVRDGQGRVAGLEVNGRSGQMRIHARVVVGADGRYSMVRKLSEIPTRVWKHGYDLLWAKVPAPPGWPAAMRFGYYGGAGFAIFTAYPHHVQVGWRIAEGGFRQVRAGSVDAFTDVIAAAAPELGPAVKAQVRDWNDFTVLSVQSCMAERWADDGLLLIGDAAHTMSPAGGIGVNAAMADAEAAAEVIAAALSDGDLSRERLRQVELRRRALVEKQQATQLQQEKQNYSMMSNRLKRWFAHRFLRALDRNPAKKKQFFLKSYVAAR